MSALVVAVLCGALVSVRLVVANGAPMPRVDYAGVASYTSYRHRQARTLPALRRSLFIDPCNAAAHLSCLRALKCAHFDWTTAWRCRVIAASAHQRINTTALASLKVRLLSGVIAEQGRAQGTSIFLKLRDT
ncbi:hypothetical protein [Xanthomonas campestris]|uniref:hypothetical protein n=1 Tax=Xanthomonas campestris TaxID=339 RepID=UPI001C6E0C55|nr:hypothetical protein [Xanthomonas campestris]MEA9641350.1 hypothetical protein [Xanthomonas campestris]MEA9671156.1 hypothetical protein [Xanthomonas campestris]MEA9694862.1 hypothetical protein [Xanthomonas campestris]WVL61452.1 hypothetical protein LLE68_003310 [Xanthomonas campestris pv. barbareae]